MPQLDLTIQQILDIYTTSYDDNLKRQIVHQLERLTAGPAFAGGPIPVWETRVVSCEGFNEGCKIPVIKALRQFTGMGLKDAKDFVEGVGSFARMTVADPERFKRELEEVGGKIRIHPIAPAPASAY